MVAESTEIFVRLWDKVIYRTTLKKAIDNHNLSQEIVEEFLSVEGEIAWLLVTPTQFQCNTRNGERILYTVSLADALIDEGFLQRDGDKRLLPTEKENNREQIIPNIFRNRWEWNTTGI